MGLALASGTSSTDGVPAPLELPEPWRDARVAVVVPTYNEAGNLPQLAERVLGLPLPSIRLIVADDNSPDGTGQIADELASQANANRPDRMVVLHREAKEGIGRAYIAAMTEALSRGDEYVVQMDGDLSHSPEFIPRMLGALLATESGLVIGSRYVIGGSLSDQWGWHRRVLSRGAGIYINAILHLNVRDTTGGFKLWRANVLKDINLDRVRSDGYSFQVEMNYLCKQHGHRILEIPIHFNERHAGSSKISFAVQLESIKTPFALRMTHRRR